METDKRSLDLDNKNLLVHPNDKKKVYESETCDDENHTWYYYNVSPARKVVGRECKKCWIYEELGFEEYLAKERLKK